jgi:two-component system, OmpR family, sensor histidine kinase ChvG
MQSTLSTAPGIAIQEAEPPGFWRRWTGKLSLRQRILAVNVFALVLLGAGFFYLDSYRLRMIEDRVHQSGREAQLIATAMRPMTLRQQRAFIGRLGKQPGLRLRLADPAGKMVADSWNETGENIHLIKATEIPWTDKPAGWIDEAVEFIVDSGRPVLFEGFAPPSQWQPGHSGWALAADRTHMIWADATVFGKMPLKLHTDWNAVDIRHKVRDERTRLATIILIISVLSILLSLFLARTIAVPLRTLAQAAQRVRSGRDREVNVPRLPFRSDEIGLLARSLSDMTHTLREQMDGVEAFAADVAHELKNPLASLSSATESLRLVSEPALRDQLLDIVSQDVRRLDRLISDIAELSRIDSRLARTSFERIDLGTVIPELLAARLARDQNGGISIAFARPSQGSATVHGDSAQLSRVIDNLLSNGVSFSPSGGVVRISATRDGQQIILRVEDDGPGIPDAAHDAIFERFHSVRPADEDFGRHSGLGLSIARTIVNGHGGTIAVERNAPGERGARFTVRLPAVETK